MGTKKVRFRIGVDGNTTVAVEGGQGGDCLDITRSYEGVIGRVVDRELTADYHEEAKEQLRDELNERGL